MSTAISIENVSKVYQLGSITSSTVGEDLNRWWARLRGRPDPLMPVGGSHHERQVGKQFWALDDVNFTVRQGEVLGVIGRNGAGKSTLLKILSQVTAPSSGRVLIHGRVASLLEVGTGFHPDLTGRENIFLNGAILGMTKAEIRRNFDEIVAFSECEAFIDTPVKRYSSGMYVRLAFAVAAHLESEVLIVDEVLAVGDAQFQKKCLEKMQAVSTTGRTILFVSHSMASIAALCHRALLLKGGSIEAFGDTSTVLARYLAERSLALDTTIDLTGADRSGTGKARFTRLTVRGTDGRGAALQTLVPGADIILETTLECVADVPGASVAAIVRDNNGFKILDVNSAVDGQLIALKRGEAATIRFRIRDVLLKPGFYNVSLSCGRGHTESIDHVESAGVWNVGGQDAGSAPGVTASGVYQCRFEHDVVVKPS